MNQYSKQSLLQLLHSDQALDRKSRDAIIKLINLERIDETQLMEKTYRQAKIGTWQNDLVTGQVFWSPIAREIFELENDVYPDIELIRSFFRNEADYRNLMNHIEQSAADGDPYDVELKIRTAKGNEKWIRDTGQAIVEQGEVVRLYGTVQDIHERKVVEEKLLQTEQKLRQVFEHSTNLFYSHTPDHKLTYVSPQSEYFLGYHPEEAKMKWVNFLTDHPVNEEGVKITLKAIQTGKRQSPFELQLRKKNGGLIWVQVNEAPVVENGKTISIVGSLTDITDQKEAEEKVRRSLKEKETLLAEIHHRVKNNLAVVASMMQLQAMNCANMELHGMLLESVMRIKSMATIHELLYREKQFSSLNFSENVKTLVSGIMDAMQNSTQIDVSYESEKLKLNVNQAIPASLILNEVVTNSIKHAFAGRERGQLKISLSEEGGQVHLYAVDNGKGLPENMDPDSSQTLGMQLIQTLTRQLGGEYSYKTTVAGCEFHLVFQKKDKVNVNI